MTASLFIMLAAWIWHGKFYEKFSLLSQTFRWWMPLSGIYLVNLLGLAWSTDIPFGLHDIKVKLPLLALPFLTASMPALSSVQKRSLLLIFMLSVALACLVSLWFFFGFSDKTIHDTREISRFGSHIRFGLMICLSVFISVNFMMMQTHAPRYLFLLGALFFAAMIFVIQSLTGIIGLFIGLLITFTWFLWSSIRPLIKVATGILLFSVLAGFAFKVYTIYHQSFSHVNPVPISNTSGKQFIYDAGLKHFENGFPVWKHVDAVEIITAWKQKSGEQLEISTMDGMSRFSQVVRYLTSLGLPKDKHTINSLTIDQVDEIKDGCTNYLYCDKRSFNYKIYQFFWDLQDYSNNRKADGHSISMRLEFLKVAFFILRENWIVGVGTGDVDMAYKKAYSQIETSLSKKYHLRAHNQYITFIISVGVLGFVLIFLLMLWWLFNTRLLSEFGFSALIYFVLVAMSMLNEDTLETQAGVCFVAFFYTLFYVVGQPASVDDTNSTLHQ